ncbi:MAG TPA: DMT family transporter [Burkholderiaceae bacterium]|nr:DMT family transporter [Burkholderiaceae bacterium]
MTVERYALDARTALLLTLPPLFWAGNAVVGRALVGVFPPLALSFGRWLLALVILVPFVWRGLHAQRAALLRQWQPIALLGFTGVACYNTFQYLALQTSPATNVTLIAASTPAFVLIAGRLFFGAAVRAAQWAGAAVSLAGVVWVLAAGDLARLAAFAFAPGDLIMLAANASWTTYTWLLRKHRPDLPLGPFLAAQIAVGAAAIAPFAALEGALGAARIACNAGTIAALAYVAILPSIVSFYVWDRGVARVGALLPVYFANLTPVFAAVLSGWLLGEAPQPFHIVGLTLILGGIQLASKR